MVFLKLQPIPVSPMAATEMHVFDIYPIMVTVSIQ